MAPDLQLIEIFRSFTTSLFQHMRSWCTGTMDSLACDAAMRPESVWTLTDWGGDKIYVSDIIADTESINWYSYKPSSTGHTSKICTKLVQGHTFICFSLINV